MSIHVQNWVRNLRVPISSHEYSVLLELADSAHADGSDARLAMETVARRVRLSRITVMRILDRLEHVHHLIVKERSGKAHGRPNRYRILIDQHPRTPPEIEHGSPLDVHVDPVDPMLEVYHGDTPRCPQGVASDATGVYHGDTPEVSRQMMHQGVSARDTGVAPDDAPGVAPDATRSVYTRPNPTGACATAPHFDGYGDPISCGRDVEGCTRFTIDRSTEELGRRELEALRARLAERRLDSDERPLALKTGVS